MNKLIILMAVLTLGVSCQTEDVIPQTDIPIEDIKNPLHSLDGKILIPVRVEIYRDANILASSTELSDEDVRSSKMFRKGFYYKVNYYANNNTLIGYNNPGSFYEYETEHVFLLDDNKEHVEYSFKLTRAGGMFVVHNNDWVYDREVGKYVNKLTKTYYQEHTFSDFTEVKI